MTIPLRKEEVKPMVDSQDMRDALASFASGVTVVTTGAESGPVGITVNSFSAVSLDPPLILWSLGKSSARTKAFENADHFAIHILAYTQKDLCMGFAKNGNAFGLETTEYSSKNVPLLNGCLARFECRRHAIHDGGDHLIFVAHVEELRLQKGSPLVYFDRAFGAFQGG